MEIGKSQPEGPSVPVGNSARTPLMDSFSYIPRLGLNSFYRKSNLVPCFNSDDVVFITDMTSNVNKSLSKSKEMQF